MFVTSATIIPTWFGLVSLLMGTGVLYIMVLGFHMTPRSKFWIVRVI